MKDFLRELADIALFVCGAMLTVIGCFGGFICDPDSADYMKCQLYAIQGLVMVLCARI